MCDVNDVAVDDQIKDGQNANKYTTTTYTSVDLYIYIYVKREIYAQNCMLYWDTYRVAHPFSINQTDGQALVSKQLK